jgi:carbamoyltransferase
MSYNVMAINPGHNGSVALVCDGKLEYYIEEERLSRSKYDGNPYRGMIYLIDRYRIDELLMCGTGQEEHRLPWTGEVSYAALVRKYYPNVKVTAVWNEHHFGHAAAAFYGSGFESAGAVIVDGAGSYQHIPIDEKNSIQAYETESIFKCNGIEIEPIYKRHAVREYIAVPEIMNNAIRTGQIDTAVTTVKAYEAVSEYLGFGYIEAGKTMGLAPYGRKCKDIPDLFYKDTMRGDKNIFIPMYPAGAHVDQNRIEYLRQKADPREWHRDPSKLPDAAKNLAWKVQKETQEYVGDLIERTVDMTGEDNIVVSGGYGLNVIANYYYKERFPELNIYIDPISHDGGTAIGYAKHFSYEYMKENEIEIPKDPLTTLYLGPKYEYNERDLERYDGIEVTDATDVDVAQLIKDRNIISIFQGRAEAGPRALGNRSIVYDPTDPNGKDFVNTVKGREWFRPFAGSILQEHAKEWFDLRGCEETPYMMYAMEMEPKHIGELPAVTHVDGTCRIQTVTQEQNKNYYNLINEFYKLSGVPLVFNTSFNLGGQPLVETLDDAIFTLSNSKLEYLYMPELGKLIKVANKEE